MTELHGSGAPLGGTGLGVEDYAAFLRAEYLGDYVRAGGAAVRFIVPGDTGVASRWHAALAAVATAEGYHYVLVDAAETRVHLVDQIYAALARTVDWQGLAAEEVRSAWADISLPAADHLTVTAVAAHHDVDPREAARSLRRQLETSLLNDTTLTREFRLALLRLCQAELATGDVSPEESDAVTAWLRVEPVALRPLRSAGIHARLGRHNARAMLVSLASWRGRRGGGGVVLDLDLHRLAVARRPPLGERTGIYYSKAAVLDAYEVLRQLVDAVDQLHGAVVAVTLPPALLADDVRGLAAYSALHLRVIDEVRDRRRANPFAALVRLETQMEAVA